MIATGIMQSLENKITVALNEEKRIQDSETPPWRNGGVQNLCIKMQSFSLQLPAIRQITTLVQLTELFCKWCKRNEQELEKREELA